jgi:hypothetical protein
MLKSEAAEMSALRERFPKPTLSAAAFQALSIVAMNGYLLYLVFQNESSPVAIAVYSALELIALSIISNLALISVPKELRVGSPDIPVVKRIVAIAAVSALLCGIFWLGVGGDREHIDQLRQARNPIDALRELHILWPLLATMALAASGSIADRLRWSNSSGPFVTGAALSTAPKFLTAILGPVVAVSFSDGLGRHDTARAAIIWCVIYLSIKSAFELLVLAWQFFGMPERKPPTHAQR